MNKTTCVFCGKVLQSLYKSYYCNNCNYELYASARYLEAEFYYYDSCFTSYDEIVFQRKELQGVYVKFLPETKKIEFRESFCKRYNSEPLFGVMNKTQPFYSMILNSDNITIDYFKKIIIKVLP